MTHLVVVTDDALADLAELDDFISANDSPERAAHVLSMIEKAIRGLGDLPNRGHYPQELLSLGMREYREIGWTAYRIIHRVSDDEVCIYVVADSRRDLQELLQRRLLSA